MTEKIKSYKKKLQQVQLEIRTDLISHFQKIDYLKPTSEIQIIEAFNESDLDRIITGQAFYIILTDKKFEDNFCIFKYKNQTAIYRGHSYFTKKRVSSHLRNEYYSTNRKKYDPNYTVCLKIKEKQNGINIDKYPFNEWKWTVIILKMKNSTKLKREQAEKAFDELYNRPCTSRELTKK